MKPIVKKTLSFFTIILLVIFSSCQSDKIDPKIETYLNSALDSIKNNALNSEKVNWDQMRTEVFKRAKDAKKTVDTYKILEYVLEQLDDNHSFLQKGGQNLSYPNNKNQRPPSPYNKRKRIIQGGIHEKNGVRIARVFIPSGGYSKDYAQTLYDKTIELATQKPCGWIVDLRGNGGGNMWPMLAGIGNLIGNLIGNSPLGGSIYGNGEREKWIYEEGKAIYISPEGKEYINTEVQEKSFDLNTNLPLAFLIDGGTGSSGEAIAIILKGRENTRGFGEATYGASTATKGFMLSDSLNLVLAVATFEDRNQKKYLNGVSPDVHISVGDKMMAPTEDPIIEAALSWLTEQVFCEKN